MKPRKEYKPRGVGGAEEKLYYDESEGFKKEKDYWKFSREKNKKQNTSSDKKEKIPQRKKQKKYHYVRFTLFAFLIGSLLFFLFSVSSAVYMFLSGSLFVSPDNVIIEIEGEDEVSAGETVDLNITVRNRNNTGIYNVELILRYPNEARKSDNADSRISAQRVDLGDMTADGVRRHDVSFDLFGREGEVYSFIADLNYTIEGSGAVYERSKEFTIRVKDSPVSLELIGPNNVYVNGRNEYALRVRSESEAVQENLVVRIDHPLNFYLFDPSEDIGRGLWRIDALNPGEEKELKFFGMFTESVRDEAGRTISVSIGPADDAVTHIASDNIVSEVDSRPFEVNFHVLNMDDHIYFGDSIEGELVWRNNAGVDIERGLLKLSVKGGGLKELSGVDARKEDGRLMWTGDDIDFSGPEGRIPFFFDTHLSRDVDDRDLEIKAIFEGDTDRNEKIYTEHTRSFLIASTFDVEVVSRISGRGGENISFRAGESVSLDVTLEVLVGVGELRSAEIVALFPRSVKVESVSASGEDYKINGGGELLWRLGNVEAGTGLWPSSRRYLVAPERKIELELTLTPEEDGVRPTLIEELHFFGEDVYIDELLERTLRNIPLHISGEAIS